MSEADEAKLYIKVVINKEKTKVLFAEAGSDFTDILISFLLLPMGKIVKVLKEHYGDEAPVIGSFNTLYDGVANLDSVHFSKGYYSFKKRSIIDPSSDSESSWKGLRINYTNPSNSNLKKSYNGVITEGADSFIIGDNLQIIPAGAVINTLSKLSIAITDMDGAETRTVAFGFNEIMALLKESLISQNPLSAIILGGSQVKLVTLNYKQSNQIDDKIISLNSKKMVLKVMIQKSTFKLLFAQADTDFINFLFGMLLLPLGRVEWYLGSETGLRNIDNLHRSLAVDNFDKHLTNTWTMEYDLIKPDLCNWDTSSNEFSPLNFIPNKLHNKTYVEGSRIYMVSDDLTVAPMSLTSSLSVINESKISLSDVGELELQVGLEEGLSIVRAALTSSTALTNGLIKPMLKKPKQET